MKMLSPKLGALLLATTALVATPALAQAPGAAPSPQSPAGDTPQGGVGAQEAPQDQPGSLQEQDVEAVQPDAEAEVEEIVVRGRFIPLPMRATSEVATFLSSADLERQGDDNAAQALTRLTGLSVVSNRFVYVRGLGERYSSALLNGSPLPSPEPLQRVVPLDLFPASILASATVQKTYSPQYPGEFGGGVIDLQTVSVPDENFLSLSVSGGINTETTGKQGLSYYGSDTDILGFDDGTRDVPGALAAALGAGERITTGNFTDAQLAAIGSSFVNAPLNLVQRLGEVPPSFGFDVSGGRSFDLGWGRLGFVGVLGYDNGWRTRRGVQQEGDLDVDVLDVVTDYAFTSTQNDVLWNALLGVGVETDRHEVQWTNLWVHNTSKEARTRQGVDFNAGYEVRDDFTEWFERELFDTQLSGEHDFDPLEISWRASWARATRDAPYEKGIRYRVDEEGVTTHDASQQQNYTRFSELEDEVKSAGLDVTYDLGLSGGREAVVSGGFAYYDNQRSSWAREFRFLALNGALPPEVQRQRVDFLLSDYNLYQGFLTLRETTPEGGAAAYEAGLRVNALYAALDAEFIPTIRTAFGVRFEDGEQTIRPYDLFGGDVDPVQPIEEQYWLPAGTLTWNFYENMQLRLGASKTLARPQFREVAPQIYVDPDVDREFIGNPYLVDSQLVNLDARWEWYFARQQFLTGGVFYKDIDKPIEAVINEVGSTTQQTFLNAPRAVLYGLELEAKKYFELPADHPWLRSKRWLIQANYTYAKSEVRVDDGDVVFPITTLGEPAPASSYVQDGSPMQGQSDHLANVQFGFEDDTWRTQATLLLTYVSERITARGRPGEPDFVQDPGVLLDFVVRQGITALGQELTLGFEARNLLDEEYQEYQAAGGGRVDVNRYGLGRSVSMSLSARF